ncbi:MAG: zf-HC2 domain-containing protein [Acidimicrobiia bacterium]
MAARYLGNFWRPICDHQGMECERYRLALSARMDSEEPGIEPDLLAHHLQTCSACRNWEHDAAGVARAVRVGSADAIPDLTSSILAAIGREPAPARQGVAVVRLALAAVALLTVFVNGQHLFFDDALGHVSRELGAFELALGVGFAAAAARPRRADGMVPLMGAFMVLLVVMTGVDGSSYGEILTESAHTLQLAGFVLTWLLSRCRPEPTHTAPTRRRLLGV